VTAEVVRAARADATSLTASIERPRAAANRARDWQRSANEPNARSLPAGSSASADRARNRPRASRRPRNYM
jgi:hypothetical protein